MYRHLLLASLTVSLSLFTSCQRADSAAQAEPAPGPATPGAGRVLAQPMTAQPTPAQRAGSVAVTVTPQYDLLPSNARELNLMVRLEGTGDAPATRAPLDLALVIDRSGSMSGDKLSDVKTAALELLETLQPEDTITLVSYSSDVSMHLMRTRADDAGQREARRALLALQARGGTALGPGLFRALEALEGASDRTRMSHLMLFSDGIANAGEVRPSVLGARAAGAFGAGVSVSTMGVGVDYNEDLMTRLADQGGGRYHFIQDSEAIASILDDEMKGLVATVARGVTMDLTRAEGVGTVRVFGYASEESAGRVHTRVGSLGAGQTRAILVRVDLLSDATADKRPLGHLHIEFDDVSDDGERKSVDVPLSIAHTDDIAAARASEHKDVTVRVAEIESAASMELAAQAAGRGDFGHARNEIAGAIGKLERRRAQAPSAALDKQIADLREAESEVAGAEGSAEERKVFTKKYKSRAYSSGKQ